MERVHSSKSAKRSTMKANPQRSRSAKAAKKQTSALRKKSPRAKAKNVRFLQASRKDHGTVVELSTSKAGRSGSSPPSSTRGLRQMSIKICEKVMESGKVTCNEVADELLDMFRMEQGDEGDGKLYDDKNIRRRLYDALNVLEAVNVVAKDSKDITWKGMPSNQQQQSQRLLSQQEVREKQVKEKQEAMREHLIQQVAYRNLVLYNQRRHQSPFVCQAEKIPVPFVIFSAHPTASVSCDASRGFAELMVDVNAPFALHDENSILSQLGFNCATMEDLKQLISQDMLNYCLQHDLLFDILLSRLGKRPTSAIPKGVEVQAKGKRFRKDNAQPKAKRFRKAAPVNRRQ